MNKIIKFVKWLWHVLIAIPHAYFGLYKGRPWYLKFVLFSLSSVLFFFLLLGAIDINFLNLFGESPSAEQIEETSQSEASVIYSADGKLMGKYFSENRSPVNYNEISPKMIETLICTEDSRFYQHHGVDWRGLFSAAKDMMHGKARGASTITQQLAKNLFKMRADKLNKGLCGHIPGVKMVVMKLKEWITAYKLEFKYNKQQILTMYLNTVDFGCNSYGIRTAAKTYFGVLPKDLTYEQSAVLVGLLKATSGYNPRINPQAALKRRNTVFANLREFHHITDAQYEQMCKEPIQLDFSVEKNYDGWGLYFREEVVDYMRTSPNLAQFRKDHPNINVYTSGLKIYTTVDSTMQTYAEHAVWKQMREVQRRFNGHWGRTNPWQDENHHEIPGFVENVAAHSECYDHLRKKYGNDTTRIFAAMRVPHRMKVYDYHAGGRDTFLYYEDGVQKKFISTKPGRKDTTFSSMDSIRYMLKYLHCSFVAMEPNTGYVKAWVGDLDFPSWKYDKVTAYRQPGSTFKLFDYTAAFNQGMSPCDEYQDKATPWEVWDKGKRVIWSPHNADGNFTGRNYSIKAAFARSINSIAVQVAKEVGIPNINKVAHSMGIHSFLNDTVPAVALGACDVSLLDLVNSYCTVINDGYYHAPILITKIVDKNGKVIYTAKTEQKKVLDYEVAYLMQDMLKGGLTEPEGTTAALWEYIHPVLKGNEFGGKTGTSSNHSDAWFVGVTPHLVAGAWVGGEFRSIHFRTGNLGQGSRTALPVFGYFVRSLLADPNYSRYTGMFPKPKQRIMRNYNCRRYFYAAPKQDDDGSDVPTDDGELHLEE